MRSTTPKSPKSSTPKTPIPAIDLPDINVWLALTCEDHQHHPRARQYWEDESAQLAFCRVTVLGLLRLATNARVMQNHPFQPAEAWKIYRDFVALPEVLFLAEPTDVEHQFGTWSEVADFSVTRWTDAYLAAFAHQAGCRMVSFDSDFRRFQRLDFLHLSPS